MTTFIIAQIFGVLGSLSLLLSTWQKKRKQVLLFVSLDSLFYTIEYILLSAWSGAISNIVSLIRTILFMYKGKNKCFKQNIILYLVISAYIITGIFTYNGIISLFPIIVSILYAVCLWQDKVKNIHIGTALMLLGWCIYNLAVGAYASAISDSILFIGTLISIVKVDFINTKKLEKSHQKQ